MIATCYPSAIDAATATTSVVMTTSTSTAIAAVPWPQ